MLPASRERPVASTERGRNAIGAAMAVLNRVAGARLVERFGLKRPIDQAVSRATRTGFQAAGAAGRTWVAARKP